VLKHLLVRAHLLVVPALALWMSVSIVQAAEECRLKPGATAPSGSKWVYRVNRADHRHCWFLSSQAAGSYSHVVHRYRHLAGDPEAAREDQQGDTDLQIASAPTNKSDVALAARLLAVSQAAAPSEKSSDDLVPHSVPIILYRLPPANAQTVTEPTIRALPAQTMTPAATTKSNVVLLAGAAAAGLFFAGGVFHVTRRVHKQSRKRAVANHDGISGPVTTVSSVTPISPLMTIDPPEDLRRILRQVGRDQRHAAENLALSDQTHDLHTIYLPDAAAWLLRPKAKPTTKSASLQLADA
jgi:hypothetical protein